MYIKTLEEEELLTNKICDIYCWTNIYNLHINIWHMFIIIYMYALE